MRNLSFLAGIALLAMFAASCASNDDETAPNQPSNSTSNPAGFLAPIIVHVNDFSITQSGFNGTRAAEDAAAYTDLKAITLAFYAGTTEVYSSTQLRSDPSNYTTFGEFSCSLPVGKYEMVAIGRYNSDSDVFVLTSSTEAGYTSERARETFSHWEEVSVTGTAGLNLDVTMSRIIARLNVISTDAVSSGVARMRTTYSKGSKSFNPTTGLATDNSGFSLTNSMGTDNGHLSIFSFLFLASDEQTMDVTIEALDANGNVLTTKTVQNVPFKRNRQTTLSGAIFSAPNSAASFQVETAWLQGETVPF